MPLNWGGRSGGVVNISREPGHCSRDKGIVACADKEARHAWFQNKLEWTTHGPHCRSVNVCSVLTCHGCRFFGTPKPEKQMDIVLSVAPKHRGPSRSLLHSAPSIKPPALPSSLILNNHQPELSSFSCAFDPVCCCETSTSQGQWICRTCRRRCKYLSRGRPKTKSIQEWNPRPVAQRPCTDGRTLCGASLTVPLARAGQQRGRQQPQRRRCRSGQPGWRQRRHASWRSWGRSGRQKASRKSKATGQLGCWCW